MNLATEPSPVQSPTFRRSRWWYGAITAGVMLLGLASRVPLSGSPSEFPGDFLWALMVYCGLGFLLPGLSPGRLGVLAIVISYAVEFSQMYQASPLINWIRHTTFGHLVLGSTYSVMDLQAYLAGVFFGVITETWAMARFVRLSNVKMESDQTISGRRRTGLWLTAWVFAATAILARYPMAVIGAWYFPLGWLFWLSPDALKDGPRNLPQIALVGWLGGIAFTVFGLTEKRGRRFYWILGSLCIFLVLNVAGCHRIIEAIDHSGFP